MRTQTQVCTFCSGHGVVKVLQQTDNGLIMVVKDCPSCQEPGRAGEPLDFHFFDPTHSANGRDNRGDAGPGRSEPPIIGEHSEVVEPDKVIPAPEREIIDDHMGFHLMHAGRKTATKQAIHMVKVHRQKELDSFRAELAMKMYNEMIALAAKYMQQQWDYLRSGTVHLSPEVVTRIESLVLKGMDFSEYLAEAAPKMFISRYGYR